MNLNPDWPELDEISTEQLEYELGRRKAMEAWLDEPSPAADANGRSNRQYFDDLYFNDLYGVEDDAGDSGGDDTQL